MQKRGLVTIQDGRTVIDVDVSDAAAVQVAGFNGAVSVEPSDGDYVVVVQAAGGGSDQEVDRAPRPQEGMSSQRGMRAVAVSDGDWQWVFIDGEVFEFTVSTGPARRARAHVHESLLSPMPGTVRTILVEVGQAVAAGQTLLVLEAMKMELPIKAPASAKVTAVHCRVGELVAASAELIELD
jgi:biotin carboxyl carrier protein